MAEQRIQKVLSDQGVCSRRAAEKLIDEGRVKVNGHPVTLGDKMDPDFDKVSIDGKSVRIVRKRQYTYLMLNKPRGYITTASDERGRKTVMDLLTGVDRRVYPIGRLDKDSEGLLLLTDDGAFANLLTHPSGGVGKLYRVTVRPRATEEQVVKMSSGVVLDDGTTLTPQQVCWWAGGALAAATYGEDLTNAVYPNAVDISPRLTHSQYVDAINSGKFVLNADDGTVRVEYDINSLVTYTSEIGEVYRYNRTMRLCNTIANDLYSQFSKNYVGIVDNTDAGRMEYKSAVVKYLTKLQASGGIQNFDGETDVTVEKGDAKDAVLITLAIEAVGSTNKIYITLDVS